MNRSQQRRLSERARGRQRITMSGQRQAEVRKRRWSSGDRLSPNRDRQCAKGTSRLSMHLVWRLASHEKGRKSWEGS